MSSAEVDSVSESLRRVTMAVDQQSSVALRAASHDPHPTQSPASPATPQLPAPPARRHPTPHGYDAEGDDALPFVSSGDAGAGRAHTPQRVNRAHTPSKVHSAAHVYTALAPVHTAYAARPKSYLSHRKLRRWDNDRLIGVSRALAEGQFEGMDEHMQVQVEWRSSLGLLVSSEVPDSVKELVRKGYAPAPASRADQPCRQFATTQWAACEERFLLVERRLRDLVVKALRSAALLGFVQALEDALTWFMQTGAAPGSEELPEVLTAALQSPMSLGPTGVLVIALRNSPFYRLLLHVLCQFFGLRAKTLDAGEDKVVEVQRPRAKQGPSPLSELSMCKFVQVTRLSTTPPSTKPDPTEAQQAGSHCMPAAQGQPADWVLVDGRPS